jgi:hypothetical protein
MNDINNIGVNSWAIIEDVGYLENGVPADPTEDQPGVSENP